jgi:hypothetical protein
MFEDEQVLRKVRDKFKKRARKSVCHGLTSQIFGD